MKYTLTIIITLAVLGVGALLFAWSGMYNIAATEPHWPITSSFIEILRDNSISAHSKDIRVPEANDAELSQAAFSHYHQMCRLCHGAPGYSPKEFAGGLYPAPPDMTAGHLQKELSQAEIYWIAKHGIKLTGMPAFGPTHDEKELWGLVALATKIPQMSPEDYRLQVQKMGQEEEGGHGHGTEPAANSKAEEGHQ